MKRLLLSAVVLSAVGLLKAQESPTGKTENAVGINEENPQATLDVNGDFRVQKTDECTGCKWVLVQDAKGMVQKLPISDFTISGSSVASQVGGTASFTALSNVEKYIPSYDFGGTVKEQGKITSIGIDIKIPYTGATAGTVTEKEYKSKENPNLVLKIKEATISETTGELEAIIYSKGGELNLKQFTLEEVKAKNYEKVEGTFEVKVKGVVEAATVRLSSIGGILDKNFADADHKFVYTPVTVNIGDYNKVWLNQNLGTEYAKLGGEHFNPTKLGGDGKRDYKAYGSLFQFGRDADGHELMVWSPTKPSTYSNEYSHRAKPGVTWITNDYSLTYSEKNDPCPNGYRTPSRKDWQDLHQAIAGSKTRVFNNKIWTDTKLNLAAAGDLDGNGASFKLSPGTSGRFWSSTASPYTDDAAFALYISHGYTNPEDDHAWRSSGRSVRCFKKD